VDNVTLTLAGVVLARSGLNRFTRNAAPSLVVGCNLPSILPIAFVGTGVKLSWRDAFLALIGVGVYSVFRLLELHLDILGSGSPWLIGVLGMSVGAPMLSNLVSGEIGASKKQSGRGWALFALAFLVLWIGAHAVMHQRAIETLQSRIYSGVAPNRVGAWPTRWNPLVWRGYVDTDESWMIEEIPLHKEFDPEAGCKIFRPADMEEIHRSIESAKFQALFQNVKYPVFRFNAPKLEVADARDSHHDLCPEFTAASE